MVQPDLEPPPNRKPAPEAVAWRVRDLFLTLVGGFMLSIFLVLPVALSAFDPDGTIPSFAALASMGILIYVALALAGWYFALQRRGVGWAEAGFRPVPARTLMKMVPVTIGLMLLNAVVVSASAQLFGDVPTAQDQVVGGAASISAEDFVWLLALGALAAPAVEEFLFRGLLYPLLRTRMKMTGAVAASAFLFAFLHMIPPLIPALLMMGIVLAILVDRYESLYPAIVVHALNNGAALTALYAAIGR